VRNCPGIHNFAFWRRIRVQEQLPVFWKYAAGYWQVEGPDTANQESYFQYWLMLMALSLTVRRLADVLKNPWAAAVLDRVVVQKAFTTQTPPSQFFFPIGLLPAKAGCTSLSSLPCLGAVCSCFPKEKTKPVLPSVLIFPSRRKRQSFLAEQRQNPNRTT